VSVPVVWYLALAAVLFSIGAVGALTRRNGITIFLSIELMLNSANLAIVAYARVAGELAVALNGQILVLFVLAVAAAEAAVGLALFIAVYRNRRTIDINRLSLLRW
jgi:NADH-quinone oxidoreductase subunit K